MSPSVQSRFISARGVRTHYLEAGEGPALVLLHSGEFGGCSELSWEFNIDALAHNFHVYAPDWLGFGKTEKLFSFEDMWGKRIAHMADFVTAVGLQRAHFVGNSMGGTLLIGAACMDPCPWPMDRIVIASGGGSIPDTTARQLLNSYDCTRDHMRRIVENLFMNPAIRDNADYVERRYRISLEPGAWECTAAARFKAPGRAPTGFPPEPDYSRIKVPALLIAGDRDNLRMPGYALELQAKVPGSELHVIRGAGHCPNIDAPDEFNRVVTQFLLAGGADTGASRTV